MFNGTDTLPFTIGSSYKQFDFESNDCIIKAYPFFDINYKYCEYSFSYTPLFAPKQFIESFGIDHISGIQTFENIIILINKFLPKVTATNGNLSMEGITEITEEEFYKID